MGSFSNMLKTHTNEPKVNRVIFFLIIQYMLYCPFVYTSTYIHMYVKGLDSRYHFLNILISF